MLWGTKVAGETRMTDLPVTGNDRGHGMTIWLTGIPAAGKTTIGNAVSERLIADGHLTTRLDGDVLRSGLCADLGFSIEDRHENVRRAGHVALILAQTGAIAIVSLISPYRDSRALVRKLHAERGIGFIEVFVDTPLIECQRRDPRGLYAKAGRHELAHMTGVDDPYEPPDAPDVHVHPAGESVSESAAKVLEALYSSLRT
jgi:adenylyl-sulfate kinase